MMVPSDVQQQADVSRRTLRVIDIIASWVVNTFYNYLHEEAVTRHSQGRAGSITEGYHQMVKAYLDTFAHHDGYGKIVISLHKYYCDAEKQAMLALDEWIREILGEFIPDDYKSIMTNIQRYDLMRNILINAIEQFSSVIICGPIFDILISNHDEPSLVPSMKKSMRGLLLDERKKMFARIHRASTNTDTTINSTANMKSEIYRLAEENVLLKSKNTKLVTQVKKAIDGLKARERVINALNNDFRRAQEKIMQLQNQLAQNTPSEFSGMATILPHPKLPADEFKSTIASVALTHGFPTLPQKSESEIDTPRVVPTDIQRSRTQMKSATSPRPVWENKQIQPAAPIPLTHTEDKPETFVMADPVEDSAEDIAIGTSASDGGYIAPVTGSDTLELNMDEFMNS